MSAEKKRNLGIDILCCLGVLLLLGVQYMDAVGFMAQPVTSWLSAIPVAVRWFCLSGASLLAAGTGYVLSTRKLSAGYFKILIRLVYIYIVCSLSGLVMRIVILGDTLTFADAVQALTQFSASETARFAEMYLALIIAAPYLNAAFDGLYGRKARFSLVLLLSLVSGLQPMLCLSEHYLLPGWCKGLFPVAAYFAGAYLRRYLKHRRTWLYLPLLLVILVLETAVVMLVCLPSGVLHCPWLDSMASLGSLGMALLLLAMLHSKQPGEGSVHRFFSGAAGGALGALLLGDLVIDAALPAVAERFPDTDGKLLAGWFVIPIVMILSCVLSLVLQTPLLGLRAYLRSAEEESVEEEFEEEETPQQSRVRPNVVVPELTHTEPFSPQRRTDSRHTIQVPVSVPTTPVTLTQPFPESPHGVQEMHLPGQSPKPPRPPVTETDEPEIRVYIPKHAAPSRTTRSVTRRSAALSSAVTSAAEAAARREKMTVDDILIAERRKQREVSTPADRKNRFSD